MATFSDIRKGIPYTIRVPESLKQLCDWDEGNDAYISGYFELMADDGETMKYWLNIESLTDRFGIFGTGPDGSLYAFWIDDEGNQKIVHLGSEGEQLYILADNFIDFLRLLAIGYNEIGFADLGMTVEEWNEAAGNELHEGVNPAFRHWVETTFNVQIPKRGNEITDVGDSTFKNWIDKQIEIRDQNR